MNLVKIYSVILVFLGAAYGLFSYFSSTSNVEADYCEPHYLPIDNTIDALQGEWIVTAKIITPLEITDIKGTITVEANGDFKEDLTLRIYGGKYLIPGKVKENKNFLTDVVRRVCVGAFHVDTLSYNYTLSKYRTSTFHRSDHECSYRSLIMGTSTIDYCLEHSSLFRIIGSLESSNNSRKICTLTYDEIIMKYISTEYIEPVIVSYQKRRTDN